MRFIVYGAGAIGGVVAARLHEARHETLVIARGSHLEAIRDRGLTLATRGARDTHHIQALPHPSQLDFREDDVVLLTTKSQHTHSAIQDLAPFAPPHLPIVCMQNGVANERTALRMFARVYGVVVMLPATFLESGVVAAHSSPTTGILDVGRWPTGADALAETLSEIFNSAGFDSRVIEDLERWKYRKLLDNLSNVVDALCGAEARNGPIAELAREEGRRCLDTIGIAFASSGEDAERRAGLLDVGEAVGQPRQGSSTWQSLARGAGTVETDYLNGEIALLGRLHGIATPVNATLQRMAHEHATARRPPEAADPDDLLVLLQRAAEG